MQENKCTLNVHDIILIHLMSEMFSSYVLSRYRENIRIFFLTLLDKLHDSLICGKFNLMISEGLRIVAIINVLSLV